MFWMEIQFLNISVIFVVSWSVTLPFGGLVWLKVYQNQCPLAPVQDDFFHSIQFIKTLNFYKESQNSFTIHKK